MSVSRDKQEGTETFDPFPEGPAEDPEDLGPVEDFRSSEDFDFMGELQAIVDPGVDVAGIRGVLASMGVEGEALEKAVIAMATREASIKREAQRVAAAALAASTGPVAPPAMFEKLQGGNRKASFQEQLGAAIADVLQKKLASATQGPPQRMPSYSRIKP